MKQVVLSEEEAQAVLFLLRTNWAPQEMQKIVYNLVSRLERELAGK